MTTRFSGSVAFVFFLYQIPLNIDLFRPLARETPVVVTVGAESVAMSPARFRIQGGTLSVTEKDKVWTDRNSCV